MTAEQYTCFFPSTPVWVVEQPDLSVLDRGDVSLFEIMSEAVLEYSEASCSIKICRDGLFMVRLPVLDSEISATHGNDTRWLELVSWRHDYLNALLLLFHSALTPENIFVDFQAKALRQDEDFPMVLEDGNYRSEGSTGSYTAERADLLKCRHRWNYDPHNPIEEDGHMRWRRVVPQSVFDQMASRFMSIVALDDRVWLLAQIMAALDSYNAMNWSASLVQGWFVIEVFLNELWIEYLSENADLPNGAGPRIDSNRRNYLTGREFTASMMSNVLELTGRIDQSVFKDIEFVRSRRNKVVHSHDVITRLKDRLKEQPGSKPRLVISPNDCLTAFSVIEHFTRRILAVDLRLTAKTLP